MTELTVISGGLREPSSTRLLADRLAASARKHLGERGQETVSTVVELRHLARSIADAMVTGFPPADLAAVFDGVNNSDALIAVSPAFNASYGGLFKSFFDVIPEATLADMPVMIGATGGTDRHSLVLEHAMRPLFSYLHAIVSPTGVYASTDDFGATEGPDSLSLRVDKAGNDFARLVTSCGRRQPRDPFSEDLQAIEDLLRDHNA
jgi:FMN reductase